MMFKMLFRVVVLIFVSVLSSCGNPEQKFRVRVVDDSGAALEGVECKAWFHKRGKGRPLDSYPVVGKSDAKGIVELKGETIAYQTSVQAEPEGYYLSNLAGNWMTGKQGGRWEPWPVELQLKLCEIRAPRPMYAIQARDTLGLFFPNKSLESRGFDLMARDWVAPHGKGKVADMMVSATVTTRDKSDTNPVGSVEVTFPGVENGIQRMADHTGGSELIGPHEAPGGGYLPEWSFPNRAASGKGWDFSGEVYVFRIRSQVDGDGSLLSAHYGKIHGRIRGLLSPLNPRFQVTYYLNGEPNERGLEWDRKNNLFPDVKFEYWPKRP